MDKSVKQKTWTRILDWEFLLSESEGWRSREQVLMIAQTSDVLPGTALGKITASGKYTPCDPAAADGSQNAVAILGPRVPGTNVDQTTAIIARSAEVNLKKIIFGKATTQGQKDAMSAALVALGIIIRN